MEATQRPGRPTHRPELLKLNELRMLEIVAPGSAEPITKAHASVAIDIGKPS